jgi:Integrase core domain
MPSRTRSPPTWSTASSPAPGPNQLWVTDISEHPTREGKVYCAVMLDAYSRRVVGWSIDASPTAALVAKALSMAINTRTPPAHTLQVKLIHQPLDGAAGHREMSIAAEQSLLKKAECLCGAPESGSKGSGVKGLDDSRKVGEHNGRLRNRCEGGRHATGPLP